MREIRSDWTSIGDTVSLITKRVEPWGVVARTWGSLGIPPQNEQLGADTLVHGRFGADRTDLTVRLSGIRHLKHGEALPLQVSPRHLHLFDPESGARLGN